MFIDCAKNVAVGIPISLLLKTAERICQLFKQSPNEREKKPGIARNQNIYQSPPAMHFLTLPPKKVSNPAPEVSGSLLPRHHL